MRKLNAIVTPLIFLLFLVHLIWGSLMLLGVVKGGSLFFSVISYVMMGLVVVHILIGIKLTVDTLQAQKKSKVSYPGANRLFWIRRISGFALVLFMAAHVFLFSVGEKNGAPILKKFSMFPLIIQLLMVLSLLLHLITNIRPLKIALGIEDRKDLKTDVMIILGVSLLLSAIAFLIYFFRWSVL